MPVFLITLLGKLVLGLPGIASGVISVLNKRADTDLAKHQADVGADVAVNQAVFSTWIAAQHDAAAQRNADRGSIWTEWMMPTAAFIALAHYGSVSFDSMTWFGHVVGSWHVATLPGEYPELQRSIIYSVAGVVSVRSVAGAVSRVFTKA